MKRKTVIAGLRAYRGIENDIRQKMLFAKESGEGGEYEREAEELCRIKRGIIRCLNDLPQMERDCLWSHYVKGEMWVRICQKHAYSERQIRNISARGLDRLGSAFSRQPELARFCELAEARDTY